METTLNSRSPQLASLSREHREGMVFVSRIRQAIEKRIPIDRLGDYTRWYWKNHIRPHFFQEEKILLPFMPADNPFAIKLKEDHAFIRDLVFLADHEPSKHSFTELCTVIETHIRFEEEEVFGWLEQYCSEEELNKIHEELEGHPVQAVEWTDVFW